MLAKPVIKEAVASKAGVNLSWDRTAGANGYVLYRKTEKTGWKRIAVIKGATKTSYEDKTAKNGTTYRYTAKAYRTINEKNVYSSYEKGEIQVKK